MKLQFDPSLSYQQQAIDSLVNLFDGQQIAASTFSLTPSLGYQGTFLSDTGVANRLSLSDETLLENLQKVQVNNGIAKSAKLVSRDFDCEMETGTGKTYVYLRSIMELHRRYGFCKFIVVVPSLAIKEGVYKSLQITEEHFRNLYDNQLYTYFVYDSSKLEQVRSFALADQISIMVINIDAFRKSFSDPNMESKANIIHRTNDRLNGMKPIELIQDTHPILIIDEPQSVDTTAKAKQAIQSLNPLITFRFSATHVQKHHKIYELDAVDAFDLGIVKGVQVTSFESRDEHNLAYIKLISVSHAGNRITARIELDVQEKNGIQRKTKTVCAGDDLYETSHGRDLYDGYILEDIDCTPGREYISFNNSPDILKLGQAIGEIDQLAIKEQQIRATITEHFERMLQLKSLGIKVLSLFFVDRVANYRTYDEDGNPQKGIYATLFEKQFIEVAGLHRFQELFENQDIIALSKAVHNGYFATDNKGKAKDTSGETQADEDAYALIMKEKEKLLSFDTKLSFIFSHSALREGWDNPNVFQICTLNETRSEIKKRQEIGRGLRLCVNQNGERQFGSAINTLTVMANESYDEFCRQLQNEYEAEGIRFGVLQEHDFARLSYEVNDDIFVPLGEEISSSIYQYCLSQDYIRANGQINDKLREDIKENRFSLPSTIKANIQAQAQSVTPQEEPLCEEKKAVIIKTATQAVAQTISKQMRELPVRQSSERRKLNFKKEVFLDPDFQNLWEHIKYQTTYRVHFNSDDLIQKCVAELETQLIVPRSRIVLTTAQVSVGSAGVSAEEVNRRAVTSAAYHETLPDVVAFLQNKTKLTRKTLVSILNGSGKLHLFKRNPQKFMDETARIISSVMRSFIVDGIKYSKIGDDVFYAQELFETQELIGYLEKNMISVQNSIYDYVIYDSVGVERKFAEKLDSNAQVKVFAKLPGWFMINTPLGSYNPDWAVVVDDEGENRLFFVLETKGSIMTEDLRPREKAKIKCGYKHFEALGSEVMFRETDDFKQFIESV